MKRDVVKELLSELNYKYMIMNRKVSVMLVLRMMFPMK